MISFGPIPSRRLGKSLGINNIPSQKECSYSCIYCQIGVTKHLTLKREKFYEPEVIYKEVQNHLRRLKEDDKPDYLTFVSNGEPTLDSNLGKSIEKLKLFNIPIAVITNASLLYQQDVRLDLNLADLVSLKVDTNDATVWKTINRPHTGLDFRKHVESLLLFSSEYKSKLVTETMLVDKINDNSETLKKTAELVAQINPFVAYLSIPTRPPAIFTVKIPDEPIDKAYQIFSDKNLNVELLIDFEGTKTGCTGNPIEDIINICTVHPIREDTMQEILKKDHAEADLLDSLIRYRFIKKVKYKSMFFYIRQFHN